MVLLRQQKSSLKREREREPSSSFRSPFPYSKVPKSLDLEMEKMVSILADAGCTLINHSAPPSLPSDPNHLQRHLTHLFSGDPSLSSNFLAGFSTYIQSRNNLTRVLNSLNPGRNNSIVRHLLLVPSIQLDLMNMLLEKLPEFFDINPEASLSLQDDVGRLIINQFRWLDFLVDPQAFTDKLMQLLCICPLHLKKEIIGSLPEIIGDQSNNKTVVDSLHQILREDSAIIVPVLDCFSNLNLDDQLQEQVITIALSCIRTIDAQHMPYLLRFLLLSATQANVRMIICHIRQHLKFVGVSNFRATQQYKLKGKSLVDHSEASILDALRSSLRFKNMLCQEILKELNSLQKPRDHKVIDIWLLVLMYTNGDIALQRSILKLIKKKIIEDCIQEVMLDQCIRGNKELVQDYFPSFLSFSEYLLGCKEQKTREFGIYMYTSLFEEFTDTYSRQEVLGALITHVGSGVSFEVSSALETMALLASKYAPELIPLSSHINGILDYLEGFSVANLHKVYEVFSHLALSGQSSAGCLGSSIANELLMIVRKQVSHTELKYKKMGLIGTLKIVSCLGDASNVTGTSPFQKSNAEEALELLKTSLNSCKQMYLPLILFYDELTTVLNCRTLQPEIIEWIAKHVGEFESMFLSDLEGGQLPIKDSYCGLEGELWMNLDGDISPICLNILPSVSSSLQSDSLQILPAKFLLLSAVERLTNQGSLGGIDALLGCPLHLPSSKYFSAAGWQSLTEKQKQIVSLSLYYAANWIRELLNAFCTQVAERLELVSQATKQDIIAKLLKRLRNLVFLESLLNYSIKCCPQSLPELHLLLDQCGSLLLHQPSKMGQVTKKNENKKIHDSIPPDKKRKHKKISKSSTSSDINEKLQQPTILDVLRKAGSLNKPRVIIEVSTIAKDLETQRFKFRPLQLQCLSFLTFSKNQDSCCSDPAVELPLYLYLLRDFHYKLDYFTPPSKQLSLRCWSVCAGFTRMTTEELLSKVKPVFPSLKRQFENAVCILKGGETCQDHWKVESAISGNPDIQNIMFSNSSVSTLVIKEVLSCFSKMLNLPDMQMNKPVLSDLLQSFQPVKIPDAIISGLQPTPLPGTIEYLYLGVFSFLEDVLNIACSFSFMVASESLLTLESVVISLQGFLDKLGENSTITHSGFIQGTLHSLLTRLGISAQKLLKHNWDDESLENGWKNKGEIVQKILWIYLEHSESTTDLLDELACTILPQVTLWKTKAEEGDHHGFPALCPATFVAWYRVLHEVNLSILNKLVKEAVHLEKRKAGVQPEIVQTHLTKTHKCVNVVVSLVNMCRTHDKVTVHAMAVKYGGTFVDTFLKAFDFLQVHFQTHNEITIQLVKELQKATRTIQILCSEAKGLKQTVITSKIPSTKRSMERFLFRVKALLHTSSSGCTFWMGNLKHKDLMGQVVSSQAYVDDPNTNFDEDQTEAVDEDQPVSPASADRQTE
ncbi:hypothetical protein Pint_36585 [Pistacia integerrima]|uniref:Uncharacterized protein n=1 Tax=Pistacia integerrima TaxID=434235 RepID=A0ACC0Y1T6_9ROSI|nr:hypothetical protein Pint_36585 [Pistacia integerrima]